MKKRWVLILGLISFAGITSLPPSSSYGQKVWHKEVVDSSGQLRIGDIALKVSPNKIPVISFIFQPNPQPDQDKPLEIRLKQNGEWKSIVTDPSLINISGLSMGIDPNENFHFGLIRKDQATGQWRPVYSIFNQTSWATEEIDTFDSQYVDIGLDSNGLPAICYICNIGTEEWPIRLICEYKNAEKWKELIRVGSTSTGDLYYPSIRFDSGDFLHLSYSNWPNSSYWPTSTLDYIKYGNPPDFEPEIVWGYGTDIHIQESKIVVNSKRLPQIIYVVECPGCQAPGPVQLNHIYKVNNNEWSAPGEQDLQHHIDGAGVFPSISMDIDSNDDLHILYSKIQGKAVMIMYGHWDYLIGSWELSEIDSWKGKYYEGVDYYGVITFQTSLSIDSQNNVHIAYVLPQDKSGNGHKLIYGVLSEKLPAILVTPTTYGIGNVKLKRRKMASFKVKNNGTADLLISTLITGTDASMFSIVSGGGSKTIKPGRILTISVAFKPTSTGSKTSTLEITSNDPTNPTVDIALSGTGQ